MKKVPLIFILSFITVLFSQSKAPTIQFGAYYFDGWSSFTKDHITSTLIDNFPEREPKWGWVTSTPNAVKEQIDEAANAGLSFFSFCWYYSERQEPLNRALNFYLNSHNRKRLNFCLMVANHEGYLIGPKEWSKSSKIWLELFKSNSYVKVDGKPVLIFFSMDTLVSEFGNTDAVYRAFDELRKLCFNNGLQGVTIAVCSSSSKKDIDKAVKCGFDVLTGYNNHEVGFKMTKKTPIDSLIANEHKVWDLFKSSPLPYIPSVTLNWDPRPWAKQDNWYASSSYYTGYSAISIIKSIESAIYWLRSNKISTTKERLALIYAWNEYGEGAWLTPSKYKKNELLNAFKKAASEK